MARVSDRDTIDNVKNTNFFARYSFKCKGRDERGGKLIFQLEICSVPGLEMIVGKSFFVCFPALTELRSKILPFLSFYFQKTN